MWVDLKIEGPFDPELRGIVQEILFQNQSWKINVQSDDGSDWQIILKPGHSDVELPKLPLELIYERKNSPAGPATLLSFFREGEAVLFIGDRQGFFFHPFQDVRLKAGAVLPDDFPGLEKLPRGRKAVNLILTGSMGENFHLNTGEITPCILEGKAWNFLLLQATIAETGKTGQSELARETLPLECDWILYQRDMEH